MIQKLFFSLLIIFFTACNNSSSIYPKGVNKKVVTIYYIHREHCPGCEYMDEVLKNKEIKAILKNGYRVIVLDVNEQDALPTSLEKTRTTPTFYFVDSSNRKIAKDEHVLTPKQFKQKLLEIKR